MNKLSLFNFGPHEVRELEKDGEPWFVAKDVAEALGYSNSRDAIAKHVDDEFWNKELAAALARCAGYARRRRGYEPAERCSAYA